MRNELLNMYYDKGCKKIEEFYDNIIKQLDENEHVETYNLIIENINEQLDELYLNQLSDEDYENYINGGGFDNTKYPLIKYGLVSNTLNVCKNPNFQDERLEMIENKRCIQRTKLTDLCQMIDSHLNVVTRGDGNIADYEEVLTRYGVLVDGKLTEYEF